MDILESVRTIAKTDYYQTLYSQAKELKLGLFRNTIDYTYLQIWFLRYLGFYNGLQLDVQTGDVDEKVFDDFIYEDAYGYYKSVKYKKKEYSSYDKNPLPNTSNSQKESKSLSWSWNFKNPKKKSR